VGGEDEAGAAPPIGDSREGVPDRVRIGFDEAGVEGADLVDLRCAGPDLSSFRVGASDIDVNVLNRY
jgi:hypothetical protein